MALREASFKGAAFHVEETSGQFGRRTVLHEYPFRDLPYGEDLGRAARRFDMTAFFINVDEYQAFIDACESEGAGTLIHPFFGKAYVQLENSADVRYPRAEGGRYSVQLTFVEAGENTEPDATEDAGGLLDAAVDDALEIVGADFADKWLADVTDWLDIAEGRLNQVYDYLEGFLSAVAWVVFITAAGFVLPDKRFNPFRCGGDTAFFSPKQCGICDCFTAGVSDRLSEKHTAWYAARRSTAGSVDGQCGGYRFAANAAQSGGDGATDGGTRAGAPAGFRRLRQSHGFGGGT